MSTVTYFPRGRVTEFRTRPLGWLERHGQLDDVMFRIPGDEAEAGGVTPG